MKNRFVLILLMIMAVLLPLSAAPSDGESSGGFTPIYAAATSKDFTIRAYKNTSSSLQMSVYDALTTTLDQIREGEDLDLYPHISKFLDTSWQGDIKNDNNKVLFSYLITGNSVGKYTLIIDFTPFVRVGAKNIINAQFDVKDIINRFDSGLDKIGDYSIDNTCTATKFYVNNNTETAAPSLITKADNVSRLKLSWNVTGTTDTAPELWSSEGVIVMALDKEKYDNNTHDQNNPDNDTPSGDYVSTVKITLESTI